MVLQLWTELCQSFRQNVHPCETLCKSPPYPVSKLSQGQQKRDKQGQNEDSTSLPLIDAPIVFTYGFAISELC